ncbi:hypothetical protein AN958_03973 [Leucoagaricus sp. SymC.cos]|nr:hypothetical protein AN958_03973 [Leucoagaricus sp. SymC.cos]
MALPSLNLALTNLTSPASTHPLYRPNGMMVLEERVWRQVFTPLNPYSGHEFPAQAHAQVQADVQNMRDHPYEETWKYKSILDYLKDCHPDVYERTRYNIIEISGNLAKFPKKNLGRHHRLLLSNLSSLTDTIPGVNAPVVQTRFRNTTVPCSTLMVRQGYFDIFFPTNFERLRDIGLLVGERKSSVFIQTYADLNKTMLRNGENPLLDLYQNVKACSERPFSCQTDTRKSGEGLDTGWSTA